MISKVLSDFPSQFHFQFRPLFFKQTKKRWFDKQMYMYIVALIRIPLTEIFSRKHLKCQTWLPQGRKWSGEKNFFEVRGKSGNFTSSQWKFYEHESSYWSWNWSTNWWWVFKKVDPFCTILLRSYTVSIYVHYMCLAERIN